MTPVASLADRVLDLVLEAEPLEATLLGFRHLDDRLADLSVEHEREKASARAEIRAAAARESTPPRSPSRTGSRSTCSSR